MQWATADGCRSLGLKECGSIEVGKKADIIVINTQRAHLVPTMRIVSAFVHNGMPSDVESVMVDGEWIMRDGEVLIEDPPNELLSGYSFTGQILLGQEEKVLAVPEEAVFNRGGETFVLLPPENGGVPEKQIVEARVLDSDRIGILSGLSEGQEILVPLYSGANTDKLSTEGLLDTLKERSKIPLMSGE